MDREDLKNQRRKRSIIYYTIFSIIFLALGAYLLIALRALILPIVLGLLSAYMCIPLLDALRRNGVPKAAAILILFLAFIIAILYISREIIRLIPDSEEMIVMQVNVQYQVNDLYYDYMQIDGFRDDDGNFIYELLGEELDPMMETFNRFMLLDERERQQLEELRNAYDEDGQPVISDHTWENYQHNHEELGHLLRDAEIAADETEEQPEEQPERTQDQSLIAAIINAASIWLIMPVVFLFILVDDGKLKKQLISLIPNTYFEMTLTALDNVDRALGNYLRGTFLEVVAMAITFWALLILIGFDWGISILLALIGGLANVIPFFGSLVGLIVIASYALIEGHMGEITPLLPFIHSDHIILWSVIVVFLVQLIDNVYYKPVIFGSVVDLHPLVVFIAAIAGSIMFGFLGLLFAIPAIVILKELYTTIHRELKAYFLIY